MDISAKALCALPPDDSKGRVQIDTASHPCSGNGVLVSVWWRGLWLGLGMLLWAAERENYLSLFDTVISLHPMRLCSAFCTLGSASFDCRNVHMCAKDQDVCVWERERDTQLFLLQANQTKKCDDTFQQSPNFYKRKRTSDKRAL